MSNDLISPSDLDAFPGAPFSVEVVDSAVAAMRSAAGWHIAPSRTETITVDATGGYRLILNTLRLTAVTAVRNVLETTPSAITGFRWSKAGVLSGCFPCGFQSVEVDVTHGYDACPADLLPVVVAIAAASATDVTVAQEASGPFSVTRTNLSTLASWLDRSAGAALDRYTLPPRP